MIDTEAQLNLWNQLSEAYPQANWESINVTVMIQDMAANITEKINEFGKEADNIIIQLKTQRDQCNPKATKALEKFEYAISTIEDARDDIQNIFNSEIWTRRMMRNTIKMDQEKAINLVLHKTERKFADIFAVLRTHAGDVRGDVGYPILSAQMRCNRAMFGTPNNQSSEEE